MTQKRLFSDLDYVRLAAQESQRVNLYLLEQPHDR